MRIVHYTLGLPPFRGGGLVKYSLDLAYSQAERGDWTAILWPGDLTVINKRTRIKKMKTFQGIKTYQIINPLPVPIKNGILYGEFYMQQADIDVYCEFFKQTRPDVLHIHSVMGLHKELLAAAKSLDIKIVFTVHDYFGICPKTNLLYEGAPCRFTDWGKCEKCNQDALSFCNMYFQQSFLFRKYNESTVIKPIIRRMKGRLQKKEVETSTAPALKRAAGYSELREYYKDIFSMIDKFHFNSTFTKSVFEKQIMIRNSAVIGITHRDIVDKRRIRTYRGTLNLCYLGQPYAFKGYPALIAALDELYEKHRCDFKLHVYFQEADRKDYIVNHNKYSYNNMDNVFKNMDFLLVPSISETFGLVVLEAMSYGVPAGVTRNVGAKDLIQEHKGTGIIFEPDKDSIKAAVEQIYCDRKLLEKMNRKICEADIQFTFGEHMDKIYNEVYITI